MFRKNILKHMCFLLLAFSLAFTSFALFAGAGSTDEKNSKDEVFLPIIMYHSILKDKKLQNDYTISPTVFENDLKYLTKNGYTTVTVEDLINYVYHGKDLPDKCIMLTFDDGYYNNYYYAYPLLKKYKCKAVISPIASMTEKFTQTQDISVSYGQISDDDIKEMVNSGYVEIQNHSYDMHTLTPRKGVSKKRSESADDYKNAITSDITKAQNYLENVTGKKPSCFVYPFGAKSDGTEGIVRELGFVCTLTCTEESNIITRDKESLFELGRYRRDGKESMESLLGRIE
ncbi:polysaccharide deacetylase family protein [Ruminococcus sp.]|uniref:polysaccharide deacetylase family protein n=1 Tax=Ruminococcus sp. TaxID=41978 RepID=UPI00260A8335|nr:polysaccharide deacetylase family protein [Ruminococcus sp.]MDD6988675.1 polysaccharide deacetylase family protein [Ruminococcus sp.]MDY6201507.1 polysaccharide deacetylase family protein [Ruminococcus sp.]